MKTGIELIVKERKRQVEEEGYSGKHDERHRYGELGRAAACYASPELLYRKMDYANSFEFDDPFPFLGKYDKRITWKGGNVKQAPKKFSKRKRINLLAKAGALCAAEIDRLQRKALGE